MRKAAVMLATVLALGLVAVAHAEKLRLKSGTDVSIDGLRYDLPTDTVTIFGHVTGRKPKCTARRVVSLHQVTTGQFAGAARSSKAGRWEVSFVGVEIPPGDFQAVAKKRKITKKHRIIKCKPDVSRPFEALPGEAQS
jgi:hypothetical protein